MSQAESPSVEENQVSENNLPEINKISVKIPPFWSEKPERWFYQIDAQFRINGIRKDSLKFDYLISQLEPSLIDNIWDIATGSDDNKYQLAKERLTSIFAESEEKRIKRLLTGQNLGDLKPSQLLRKLKTLAGTDISERVIKTLWLENLPINIKNVVITSEEGVNRLAIMADKIYELNPPNELYGIEGSGSNATKSTSNELEELRTEVAELTKAIKQFSISYEKRPTRRSLTPGRGRDRSKSRQKFNPEGKYCYFHYRYAKKCRPEKCTGPCAWKKPENSSQ
ncbi:uncharacterized protein LOC123310354 [Coccinella septempunctata]|uniref:uncharacterized protein LOC123310354 n=1 Tax=Coccinella septempunctata TaxID=41139 RepID=UPI001D06133A|nr:uncharacterized protein LOC123310354 [Coccinella septempunctata]